MNNIKNYYENIIIYDFLIKNNCKNIFEILKINKIFLNIGFKNASIEKKKLINILMLLRLITNQKPLATLSKKNNILLKIKKNSIIGCKITLRKNNMYNFLEKIILFILPFNNNIQFNLKKKNILNFQIKNILNFFELKQEFLKFQNIPPIDVSIHTNSKEYKNIFILLNYFFILKSKSENSSIGRV